MKFRTFCYPWMLIVSASLILLWLVPGCANIVPPTGGARDSLPPVILKANPENFTARFNGRTITLEFDEFITLDDLQSELLINPPANRIPDITGKLRTLTIKIKDTLQPNTTYSYQFGNAIQDVNEGNPYKNFTYVFSTGSYIDSLTLGGKVLDAQTGTPDSTLVIMLHVNPDDSAVAKEKPRYLTRPNGRGLFMFEHLPAGKFFVFALKDEGFRQYSSPKTPFAFHGEAVSSGAADTSLVLRAFVAEKETPKTTQDGAGAGLPGQAKKDKDEKPTLKITASAASQEQDLLSPLTLTFSGPLKEFDSTGIVLADTNYQPLRGYSLTLDTTGKKMDLSYAWKEDTRYTMLVKKNFAKDTLGLTNPRADTLRFKTMAESDYGSLKINFTGVDTSAKPVLEFVQSGEVVRSIALKNNKVNIRLFKPGEYVIRILYDANGNGRWDTGDYWQKRQPEIVLAIDMKLAIKASWENEFDVEL